MEIYTGLIMEYLIERATNINPKDDLEKLLKSKKNLRVKLGVDPTAPDVTLGWYAILRMLRKFQDYGHTAVLILGEFTAQVGDPSGKSETRKVMGENEIDDNAKGVIPIIKNILNKRIEHLSKGFKRRVGLAQAIIHDPKYLILDEPTDGLDPNQKHDVRELIKKISPNKTIIISTHILEEVDAICSKVSIISEGSLVFYDTTQKFMSCDGDSNDEIFRKKVSFFFI